MTKTHPRFINRLAVIAGTKGASKDALNYLMSTKLSSTELTEAIAILKNNKRRALNGSKS